MDEPDTLKPRLIKKGTIERVSWQKGKLKLIKLLEKFGGVSIWGGKCALANTYPKWKTPPKGGGGHPGGDYKDGRKPGPGWATRSVWLRSWEREIMVLNPTGMVYLFESPKAWEHGKAVQPLSLPSMRRCPKRGVKPCNPIDTYLGRGAIENSGTYFLMSMHAWVKYLSSHSKAMVNPNKTWLARAPTISTQNPITRYLVPYL